MGDFLTLKRKDLVDRLRRRVIDYRSHHQNVSNRLSPYLNTFYENSKNETAILGERWFNAKTKKTKNTKKAITLDNTSEQKGKIPPGGASTNNNNNNDFRTTNNQTPQDPSAVYTFTDNNGPPAKKNRPSVDLSVQIVQNINEAEPGQRIETNVTVSSTLKSMPVSSANKAYYNHNQSLSSDVNIQSSSGVECKQEEGSLNQCYENPSNLDLENEVQKIIEIWERNGEFPQDLLNLNFDYSKPDDALDAAETMNILESYSTMKSSPSVGCPSTTEQFGESNNTFDSSLNGIHSQNSLPPYTPMTQTALNMSESTGPAAETLKQMAAQHQNQLPQYAPMKSTEPLLDERYTQQRADYPNYPPNATTTSQTSAMFTYEQQHADVPTVNKQNSQLSYAGTKPLSHFNIQAPPSSLQQLQNQVRSQFNAPGMSFQMSQSQHMQMSHAGGKHMEISQVQEMHLPDPNHMTAMQQQSMSMNGDNAKTHSAHYEQQMKMHMYQQKMRQEQMMKQHHHAQMQQYINRPEYMNKSAPPRYPGPAKMPSATSPLQTMQNMVNQTSGMDGGLLGQEIMQTGMPARIRGPQSNMLINRMGPMPLANNVVSYQHQSAPMNPAQQNARARAQRTEATEYPGHMSYQGQHRPSISVGDSASISHSRNITNWRMMNPAQRSAAQHGSAATAVTQQNSQSSTLNQGVMPPDGYTAAGHNAAAEHMAALQRQRLQQNSTMMHQSQLHMNGSHMYPPNLSMMPQRPINPDQSVMMRQSMHMNMMQGGQPHFPPNPIHPSTIPNAQGAYTPSNSIAPQQSTFPLDFLDSAQTSNPDYFERSASTTDFNLIDEILGKG